MNNLVWLQKLQAGDKVFVHSQYSTKVCTVEKITPSGLVKVDGDLYNKSGYQRGWTGFGRPYITQWTREKQDEFNLRARRKRLIHTLTNLKGEDLENLDIEVLQEIVNRVKEKQSD